MLGADQVQPMVSPGRERERTFDGIGRRLCSCGQLRATARMIWPECADHWPAPAANSARALSARA
jgi:hypothetical protein